MIQYKANCFFLLLLLLVSVSPFYIIPLSAGTIQITDADIRSSKIMNKMININLSRAVYESHKDINTIASITSLSMDDRLSFYFVYNVVCPQQDCFLNFTLIRHTEQVNRDFSYMFKADYLVARGLKVKDLNMTSFQEHVFLKDVQSYDENNLRQIMGKDIPYNSEDAWYMLLFPTGFRNLTLTGHVLYSYILNSDMYVVHYMDHSIGLKKHAETKGWDEQHDYITYRAVFLPPSYLRELSCTPVEKFALEQHFEHSCNGGKKVKWFVGFKSTKETHIQAELFEQRAGFSYSLAKTPTRYGLMAFPFQVPEGPVSFNDLRQHEYKWDVQYRTFGVYLGYLIFVGVMGIILFLCYAFFKPFFFKKPHPKQMFKKVKKYQTVHDEVDDSSYHN